MQHQVATKANSLLEKLESFMSFGREPQPLEIRRLERESDDLARIDAASAFIVKAGIAAIRWDVAQLEYYVKSALALERSPALLLNASLTYKFVNDLDSAAVLALDAARMAPNDAVFVRQAVSYVSSAGQISAAVNMLTERAGMGLNLEEVTEPYLVLGQAIESLKIDPARLHFELKSAFEILSADRRRCIDVLWEVNEGSDGVHGVVASIIFIGGIADELRLEAVLAEALIAEPGWDPDRISVEFEYVKQNALLAS